MLRVAVPAGIGDVSWIWSKLVSLNEETEIFTPDTYPQRTYQWLHLLPKVIPAIGKHGYNDILTREILKDYAKYESWKELRDKHEGDEIIYLQPNQWFLQGKLLSEWLPDLKTDFHYKMNIPEEDKLSAEKRLGQYPFNLGIHMACIRGARAWECWLPEDWIKFLLRVTKDFPEFRIVLLGGIWDSDMALEVQGMLENKIRILDLIGKTTIGEAITILDRLTYYVGYSSGLNVMRTVLNRACTTLWPKHQRAHIYSHVDPDMVNDRSYLGFTYDDPDRIYTRLKGMLKGAMDGTIRGS